MNRRLRQFAIADLERVCPVAHYWLREYDPKADQELVEPILMAPSQYRLSPLEYDAANALSALATYELRSRAIWATAYPAKDFDDPTESIGTPPEQDVEIAARYELFRRAALVYARTLNDGQLIEAFQSAQLPVVAAKETSEERDTRIFNRCNALRNTGVKAWQQQVADEEELSVSRIKDLLKRHKSNMPDADPPSLSMLGQLKAAQRK